MKTKITSHQDLVQRRHELQRQLEITKDLIRNDFSELKEEVSPALRVASFIGKVTTHSSTNNVMIKTGTNLAIDWVTRKFFPKTNFVFKLLAPTVLSYASGLLSRKSKRATVLDN